MALSGTRTSSRSRWPSGFRKVWTVTSLGMSCAAGVALEKSTRSAAAAEAMAVGHKPRFLPTPGSILSPFRMEDEPMKRRRNLFVGSSLLVLLAGLGVAQHMLEKTAAAQAKTAVQAPRFEVDPMWPKPLPNHWVMGNTIGVGVDSQDHVYIIHRAGSLEPKEIYAAANPPASECCLPAPPVLEFDAEGNLVRSWGGPNPAYEWPESNHGITPDAKGNLWIGGNGGNDGHILKFTREGKFIKQFGFAYASAGSNDEWAFNKVAKISIDDAAN